MIRVCMWYLMTSLLAVSLAMIAQTPHLCLVFHARSQHRELLASAELATGSCQTSHSCLVFELCRRFAQMVLLLQKLSPIVVQTIVASTHVSTRQRSRSSQWQP